MASPVINCADVTDCTELSWDLNSCICNSDGCTPADGEVYPNQDALAGLLGQFSTSSGSSGTAPSTGGGSATWSNIANAQADDGSVATITADNGTSLGSEYLVLADRGFNIPPAANIVGIAAVIKAFVSGANPHLPEYFIYNCALTLGGQLYYFLDPRGDFSKTSYTALSPYPNVGTTTGGFDYSLYFTQGAFAPFLSTDFWVFGDTHHLVNVVGKVQPTDIGTVAGCSPPHGPNDYKIGPGQKNLYIPTLKQSWAASDVNDPSFGVAVSIFAENNTVSSVFNVDCIGMAVYYTPGVTALRRPNVCVNT